MSRYIPSEIANSEKQGFSAPDASWFKGESIEYVRREILDRRAKIYDYFDYDAVHSLVDEHLTGKQNRRLLIWSLLSFEWWIKKFLSKKGHYVICFDPRRNLQAFYELVLLLTRHRQLTIEMARRELTDRYAGQIFGILWTIGHPLVLMSVYAFIFSVVFKIKISDAALPLDYTTYILSA